MKQITLSGVIGWDATASDLRDQLKAANGEDVELVISSPGGFVSTGLEMFNLIRNYPGNTVARLSGYAMSIASYIPLAAKKIIAEDNAIYMIHNARGGVFGDHNDIINYGNTTKGMSKLIARAYAKRTGKSIEELEALMDKETYFFGQDMIDHGFVDELIDTGSDNDEESARAMACMAFTECGRRMSADLGAVKQDLAACATILNSTQNQKPASKKEKKIMDLQTLKAEHPELVKAVIAEALADHNVAMATAHEAVDLARVEGAAAETARIQSVLALSAPGREAILQPLAFDGKSSKADAALALAEADAAFGAAALRKMEEEAPPVVPPVVDEPQTTTMKRADFNALNQDQRRAFFASGGKLTD